MAAKKKQAVTRAKVIKLPEPTEQMITDALTTWFRSNIVLFAPNTDLTSVPEYRRDMRKVLRGCLRAAARERGKA